MDTEQEIKLLKIIYSFVHTFRPHLTEAEFLQEYQSKDEIEILADDFIFIEGVPHTRCRYSFSRSRLTLTVEVGNYLVRSSAFEFNEAIEYFENTEIEKFIELSNGEKEDFFEAYALAHDYLDLDDPEEFYVEHGGGNIEDFSKLKENRFKLLKEQIIELFRSDNEGFLKALISIEIQDTNEELLKSAYENYIKNNQPLLNQNLF